MEKLATLLRQNRDSLLAGWRKAIEKLPSAKGLDRPTLNDHIPAFLEDLTGALEANFSDEMAEPASGIEAHGGTIAIESKPGTGSTFRFTLPDQTA